MPKTGGRVAVIAGALRILCGFGVQHFVASRGTYFSLCLEPKRGLPSMGKPQLLPVLGLCEAQEAVEGRGRAEAARRQAADREAAVEE